MVALMGNGDYLLHHKNNHTTLLLISSSFIHQWRPHNEVVIHNRFSSSPNCNYTNYRNNSSSIISRSHCDCDKLCNQETDCVFRKIVRGDSPALKNLVVDALNLADIGLKFEHHAVFPARTNTEFVQVFSHSHLKMRVSERGAGATLACGTGACAVFVAAFLEGRSERLVDELNRANYTLSEGDAATFLPYKSHGRFLWMFLGPINVRATRKDVQLKVKEEYYSFRDRTAYLFLFFPSLLLVLRSKFWDGCFPALPVQLYQAWLLFLYTGLALRENILRVNGSDIRPWWIYHHYCAMGMALISLTWEIERQPNCAQK